MPKRHMLGYCVLFPFKLNHKIESEEDTLGRRNYVCKSMDINKEWPIYYMTESQGCYERTSGN